MVKQTDKIVQKKQEVKIPKKDYIYAIGRHIRCGIPRHQLGFIEFL